MAERIALIVFEKVAEKVVDKIWRQFSYIFCYNSNITNMTDGVQDLHNKSVDVKLLVDRSKRNLQVIATNVEVWLKNVEEIEKAASEVIEGTEKVKNGCLNGWCPNLKHRYLLSRKAVKQTMVVLKLKEEGADFTQLAYPAPPTSMTASTSRICFEVFESRISKTKEIIEALKNSKIYKIGICGLGGVGKTRMVKEIRERAIVENLFDEVAMAVVSQNQDLVKIQDQLASALDLKLDKTSSTYDRGTRLQERLKQDRSTLIILDDVWEELDLGELGIPVGGEGVSKGCKVLLTSRNERVCVTMGTQENFTIQPLSDQEAWDLFKEKVGDIVETRDLHSIAKKVVNECGRLPLALITVGSALKGREKYVWKDALEQLKTSTVTNIEGMDTKVYSILRLSYDYLERNQISTSKKGSNEIQRLFLLCCLFPEDYDIPIECLVRYAWGLRLSKDVKNLEAARNRINSMVDRLKSCYLLLASDMEGHVKMHDVVRDFGLIEASNGENVYLVRHDAELKELPQNDTMIEPYTAISIGTREKFELPTGLNCPKIQILKLVTKGSVQISRDYFGGMKELKVISFEGKYVGFAHMVVESPPKAAQFLSNVRTLCLEFCRFSTNIHLVGSLEKLEILSFFESEIDVLPREVGQLINLKLLDLRCDVGMIAPGVLSCLSKLEELYMGDYFHGEGVEERNQGHCARVTEICSLSCLKTLQISMLKPELLLKLKDFPFEKLKRFEILVSTRRRDYCEYEFPNQLRLNKVDAETILETNICGLMSRTKRLGLSYSKGLSSFVKQLDTVGFMNLEELFMSANDDMIELFNGNLLSGSLGRLEHVRLDFLSALRHFWSGPIQPPCLLNLKVLKLCWCETITSLFSLTVAGCLRQLQRLEIHYCEMLEEIVSKDGADYNKDAKKLIQFPKLNFLDLYKLPSLNSFVPISDIPGSENNRDGSLFDEVLLPSMENLEKVRVSCCDLVETLFDFEGLALEFPGEANIVLGQLHSIELFSLYKLRHIWKNVPKGFLQGFQNLTSLVVQYCGSMSYLFSPCIAKLLVNLWTIKLQDCKMMEVVIQSEENDCPEIEIETMTDKIVFPCLRWLELEDLKYLAAFCRGKHDIEFPSLVEVLIAKCPKMEIFCSGSLSAPKLEAVYSRKKRCVWMGDLNVTISHINERYDEFLPLPTFFNGVVLNSLANSTIFLNHQLWYQSVKTKG
ncbi:hypothetical protein LguiB_004322 [Lonicera macranthoides]